MKNLIFCGVMVLCLSVPAFADISAQSTVQDFRKGLGNGISITNTGDGELVLASQGVPSGTSITTTSLPVVLQNFACIKHNGYLYVLGGYTGSATNDRIYRSAIDATNGALSTFTNLAAMPIAGGLTGAEAVNVGEYIYLIGGESGGILQNKVYKLTLDQDGNLLSSEETSPLPVALKEHRAVIYGGRIFVLGGYTGSLATRAIFYADVLGGGTLTAWTQISTGSQQLPVALRSHAALMLKNRILVLGGSSSNKSYYCDLNPDLTLSAWHDTGVTLPQALDGHAACYAGGYIVISGGLTGGVPNRNLYLSKYDAANGLSASWTTKSNALPSALSGHRMFADQERLYVLGGTDGSNTKKEACFFGKTLDGPAWQPVQNNPNALQAHRLLVQGNRLYLFGGRVTGGGPVLSSCYFANILSDCTLSGWTLTDALPVAMTGHAALQINGQAYIFGGANTTTALSSVFIGTFSGDRIFWRSGTTLPTVLSQSGAVYYNSRVYITGGALNGGGISNKIYYASLDTNGNLGAWTTNSVNLPYSMYCHASAVYGNKLYILGGYALGTGFLNTVYYATINPDGSVGVFNTTTALPGAILNYESTYVINNNIYFIGGNLEAGNNLALYTATFDITGLIPIAGQPGTWTAMQTPLPAVMAQHATALYGNNTFFISAGLFTATNYRGFLESKCPMGDYTSPIIDLGCPGTVNSIGWDMVTYGQSCTLGYRLADQSGQWGLWSAFSSSSPLSLFKSARYVQYRSEFSTADSQTSVLNSVSLDFDAVAPTPTPTATPIPSTPDAQIPERSLKVIHAQIDPVHGELANIQWTQPQNGPVTITIYSMLGGKIITLKDHLTYPKGQIHEVTWDGRGGNGSMAGSGIYIVLLQTDGYTARSKIAVVK